MAATRPPIYSPDAGARSGTRRVVGRSAAARPLKERVRRLLTRLAPVILLAGILTVLVAGLARGPETLAPGAVSATIHDDVMRDVIQRTEDYSMTIGHLDCVEFERGRGNCLATATSQKHRTDHVMIAVAYDVDPGNGHVTFHVNLP